MFKERVKVNLGVFGVLLALFLIAYWFGHTLTPFIVAAVFAYTLNPAVGALERRRVPRGAAVAIFISVFFVALSGIVVAAVVIVSNEVSQLISNMPHYVDTFEADYLPRLTRYFGLAEGLDVKGLAGMLRERLAALPPESIESAALYALKIVSGTVGFFLAVFNLMLIPVFMAYLLLDFEKMKAVFGELLPKAQGGMIMERLGEVETVLRDFVKGQLLVAVIMGLLYSIGLWIAGVDMPVLVGMCAGLLNLVPYLGSAIGIIISVGLVLLKFQDWLHPVMVIAVFAAVQAIEGYIITPKVVGEKLGLHPVIVFLSLMVFGQLMGFLGILLALPIAAVLKVFVVGFVNDYKDSEMYAGKIE